MNISEIDNKYNELTDLEKLEMLKKRLSFHNETAHYHLFMCNALHAQVNELEDTMNPSEDEGSPLLT